MQILDSNIISRIKVGKPFFVKNSCHDIFSWKELENLLNIRPLMGIERFHIFNNEQYTWPKENWLSDVNTYPPSLVQHVVENNVCYISDASRVNFKINKLCEELEASLNVSSDSHIFFSLTEPKESNNSHNDLSDNLIVQVEGKTLFNVWYKVSQDSKIDLSIKEHPPDINVIMEPGDVIFIPRLYFHRALSLTKRLSISFPFITNDTESQDRHWITLNHKESKYDCYPPA